MLRVIRVALVVLSAFASGRAAAPTPAQRALSPVEERELRPGDEFRECAVCPQMVVLPPGAYLMGSPESELDRDSDEGPQHEVTIPEPFAVGKFEASFAEWDACLADGGCNGYRPSDLGWGRGKQPVIIVSWEDARAFVAWLSAKTGRPYRLLSEAEWEYAARAGSDSAFWWGPAVSTGQANYDGSLTYAGGDPGEFRHRTMQVDSFEPNAFGLYNVHGNVWEWLEDCYHRRYDQMPESPRRTGAAWTEDGCELRVFRGGSWGDAPSVLRAANRGRYEPFIRNTSSGFRVGRTLSR
ncbi:MAG: formylglycine-generating enzyme family protein [Hyphomicrobiaceae bacterium]|nr:formylglycine-generating enzyme family protein [Hyphomicrobiaceae bacterium]